MDSFFLKQLTREQLQETKPYPVAYVTELERRSNFRSGFITVTVVAIVVIVVMGVAISSLQGNLSDANNQLNSIAYGYGQDGQPPQYVELPPPPAPSSTYAFATTAQNVLWTSSSDESDSTAIEPAANMRVGNLPFGTTLVSCQIYKVYLNSSGDADFITPVTTSQAPAGFYDNCGSPTPSSPQG